MTFDGPFPTCREIAQLRRLALRRAPDCDGDSELGLTVIQADYRGRITYQVYAVDGSWTLVGIFGLYTDSLAELQAWRG
jgi:hypothetical protein